MTTRLPVGIKRVNFFDGMQVTKDTVVDEQNRHVGIDAAAVANFLGSGVIEHAGTPNVILDTDSLNAQQQGLLDGYSFDGQDVYIGSPLATLTDTVKGVQLAVEMTGVELAGAEVSRVAIIGDAFDDSLIHDNLEFEENGTQITRGRYKAIRAILFNNFAGNLGGSRSSAVDDGYNLIGRCVIREAKAMEVSRDTRMAFQVAQPDQFFSSFSPAITTKSINQMLQDAIGSDKSPGDLNVGFASVAQRELAANDVTTRIGQKFKAEGTNIQKVTILLSVKEDTTAAPGSEYNWSGQIVLNLHALQAQVDCPTDPVPDNLVDFDPNPAVIGQLTLTSDDLINQGITFDDGYAKKVDFVFTGASISDPQRTTLVKDAFYVVTVGRAGDASIGTLLIEEATHTATNGYMVVFDGESWVNIFDSDMWFEIHGDYIKVADGISYQDGVGSEVPRLKTDATGVEVAFVEGLIPFFTAARGTQNFALVENDSEFSDTLQDPRTGNPVSSRVAPVPGISMIRSSDVDTLVDANISPVLLAKANDDNPRGNPVAITGTTATAGLVFGDKIDIIAPNADILANNLLGSMLRPNTAASGQYRIIRQEIFSDLLGDVDGDGEITSADLALVNSWLPDGYDLSLATDQQKIMDGYVAIEQVLRADVNGDGVVDATDASLISDFIDGIISVFPGGSTFSRARLTVESRLSPLTTTVDIPADDATFKTAPFASTPFQIDYFATWLPDRLDIDDLRRLAPTTFTEAPDANDFFGGRNDLFVPGNLLHDGYHLNPDGTFYSVDLEVTHLSLTIPVTDSGGSPTFLDGYLGVLLHDTFVAESSDGKTAAGFPAMKYADKTYVQTADFAAGRVRLAVAIQSHSNTYAVPFGGTIDDIVGVNYDPGTSLLTLWMTDLFNDGYGNIPPALNTKVLITAFLKKAGFANTPRAITDAQVRTLFNL